MLTVEQERLREAAQAAVANDFEYGTSLTNEYISFIDIAQPAVILDLLALVKKLQGWVSVEDRLPENNCRVLVVFWPYDNRMNERVITSAWYSDGTFFEDGDEMHPPSHWMSMLTLPEIEDETVEKLQGEVRP